MKKSYIALAVLSTAALASCQQNEISNDVYVPKEGEVLFRVTKNGKDTKSAEFYAEVKGETISLGTDVNGTEYVLEETITNLNDIAFAPATKGTPGYTENFSALYGGFNAAVYKGTSVYEADGAFEEVDSEKLIYKRKYPNDIWDKKTESAPNLYFFLRTPVSYIDANTDNLTYNPSNGKITFDYTSPAKAEDQEDMLFTSRPLTDPDDFNNLFIKADKGLPVLFHHALTGVKFAIAADVMEHVSITGVKFTGLADGGKCVVTPRPETNGYVDDRTGDYSSDSVSVWNTSDLIYGGTEFSQTFTEVTSYDSAGDGKAHFGDSFYQGGNYYNLNDATASLTFWLIPQPMTDNVKLTISYKLDDVAQPDWEIDFGKTVKGKTVAWLAGELHTYTLKVDAVKVHIADEIAATADKDTLKQNITITNTGNTKAFIRASIIGNWCSEKGEAVFGYTDFIDNPGQYVEIPSWTVDNTGGGVFDGLPGTGWVRAKDGFFYYTIAVNPEATTSALFNSYTPPTQHPNYQIAGKDVDTHFVMEIATQAVNANNLDGTTMSWQEAWTKALGTAPATN